MGKRVVVINACDFDPAKHVPYVDEPAIAAAVGSGETAAPARRFDGPTFEEVAQRLQVLVDNGQGPLVEALEIAVDAAAEKVNTRARRKK